MNLNSIAHRYGKISIHLKMTKVSFVDWTLDKNIWFEYQLMNYEHWKINKMKY